MTGYRFLALIMAGPLGTSAQAQPSLYAEVKQVVQANGQTPTDSRRLHQSIAKEASTWLPPDFSEQQLSKALKTRAATLAIIRGYLKATQDPLASFTEKHPIVCGWDPQSGITGIFLDPKPWRVKDLVDGSAAQRAGLEPGDLILSVGGLPVGEHNQKWLRDQLTGEPGSVVEVALQRNGRPYLVKLTRESLPIVASKMLEGNVGYILVGACSQEAPAAVAKAVDRLNQQGMNAVILDLRNSVGGYISAGLDIAACFAPTGAPYLDIVGRSGVKSFAVKHGISVKSMVVLLNQKTQGQSEVLAAALHDSVGASLVGQASAGRALGVGQVYRLSSGDFLMLGYGRFRTPSGRYLDSHGLQPDLSVTLQSEGDAQLDEALQMCRP